MMDAVAAVEEGEGARIDEGAVIARGAIARGYRAIERGRSGEVYTARGKAEEMWKNKTRGIRDGCLLYSIVWSFVDGGRA